MQIAWYLVFLVCTFYGAYLVTGWALRKFVGVRTILTYTDKDGNKHKTTFFRKADGDLDQIIAEIKQQKSK